MTHLVSTTTMKRRHQFTGAGIQCRASLHSGGRHANEMWRSCANTILAAALCAAAVPLELQDKMVERSWKWHTPALCAEREGDRKEVMRHDESRQARRA